MHVAVGVGDAQDAVGLGVVGDDLVAVQHQVAEALGRRFDAGHLLDVGGAAVVGVVCAAVDHAAVAAAAVAAAAVNLGGAPGVAVQGGRRAGAEGDDGPRGDQDLGHRASSPGTVARPSASDGRRRPGRGACARSIARRGPRTRRRTVEGASWGAEPPPMHGVQGRAPSDAQVLAARFPPATDQRP